MKVEKYSKSKRVFGLSYTKPTIPPKPYSTPRLLTPPKGMKTRTREKAVVKEFSKQLHGKSCLKCQGYGHFQAECANIRALSLRNLKKLIK